MTQRERILNETGRHALVDGVPFLMPVDSRRTEAVFAAFPIDADAARRLLPGNEVHPLRLWDKGLLVITVVNYLDTVIGRYIEYSIAIACTHGPRPAPRLLPMLFQGAYGTGQFVYDLPVSTEISVKGGKGIWGMPKHQANLDFVVTDATISAQYDKDGQLAMKLEVDRPPSAWLPLQIGGANYCGFRGMLMKSSVHFKGKMAPRLGSAARARLFLGDHPRVSPLKTLGIEPDPIFVGFIPQATGTLDDYVESWFLTYDEPPARMEGMESVVNLGLGQTWLEPPKCPVPGDTGRP